MSASAPSAVARRLLRSGGGRSMPIARSTVAANELTPSVGKRCGSTRSVIEATPNSTSVSCARTSFENERARSSRVGSVGERRASIERVTSTTVITSTPSRPSRAWRVETTGCAAANASSSAIATSGSDSRSVLRRRSGSRPSTPQRASERRTAERSTSSAEQPDETDETGRRSQERERHGVLPRIRRRTWRRRLRGPAAASVSSVLRPSPSRRAAAGAAPARGRRARPRCPGRAQPPSGTR